MGFLVVVGALQFVYCVLVGNYVRIFLLFSVLPCWDEAEHPRLRMGVGSARVRRIHCFFLQFKLEKCETLHEPFPII